MADQLLYDATESARITGVGRTTMFELIRTGAIESVRIGKLRRVSRSALEAYVAGLQADNGSPAA